MSFLYGNDFISHMFQYVCICGVTLPWGVSQVPSKQTIIRRRRWVLLTIVIVIKEIKIRRKRVLVSFFQARIQFRTLYTAILALTVTMKWNHESRWNNTRKMTLLWFASNLFRLVLPSNRRQNHNFPFFYFISFFFFLIHFSKTNLYINYILILYTIFIIPTIKKWTL